LAQIEKPVRDPMKDENRLPRSHLKDLWKAAKVSGSIALGFAGRRTDLAVIIRTGDFPDGAISIHFSSSPPMACSLCL